MHDAPVRYRGHGQAGELGQRRLRVERPLQRRAGVGDQLRAPLAASPARSRSRAIHVGDRRATAAIAPTSTRCSRSTRTCRRAPSTTASSDADARRPAPSALAPEPIAATSGGSASSAISTTRRRRRRRPPAIASATASDPANQGFARVRRVQESRLRHQGRTAPSRPSYVRVSDRRGLFHHYDRHMALPRGPDASRGLADRGLGRPAPGRSWSAAGGATATSSRMHLPVSGNLVVRLRPGGDQAGLHRQPRRAARGRGQPRARAGAGQPVAAAARRPRPPAPPPADAAVVPRRAAARLRRADARDRAGARSRTGRTGGRPGCSRGCRRSRSRSSCGSSSAWTRRSSSTACASGSSTLLEVGDLTGRAAAPAAARPVRAASRPAAALRRALAAVDEALFDEIRARRAAPDLAERDDIFSLLAQARDEDGERADRPRAARRADHAADRRARDHGDRAVLGLRAARAHARRARSAATPRRPPARPTTRTPSCTETLRLRQPIPRRRPQRRPSRTS